MKFKITALGFITTLLFSCFNESVDLPDGSLIDLIKVDSKLYKNIEQTVKPVLEVENSICIEFIYPITLSIFNENLDIIMKSKKRSYNLFKKNNN